MGKVIGKILDLFPGTWTGLAIFLLSLPFGLLALTGLVIHLTTIR